MIVMQPPPLLRDRDLIFTEEGFFFRVLGYWHPPDGFICDPEYTPAKLYDTTTLMELRERKRGYLKFYGDEGVRFLKETYPQYQIYYKPLQVNLIGVPIPLITDVRRTDLGLKSLLAHSSPDVLQKQTIALIDFLTDQTVLSPVDLGLFGSMLAEIHHYSYSDIDLAVYGKSQIQELRSLLADMYGRKSSFLKNEFEVSVATFQAKPSPFKHISRDELIFHQKRKLIYGIVVPDSGRATKVEFEPIRRWDEIENLHNEVQIEKLGRVMVEARITDDTDSFFMPSVYNFEVLDVLFGDADKHTPTKLVSYFEQFRMQAMRDEQVLISGVLEKVTRPHKEYYQVSLSYGDPDWTKNVLKLLKIPST
ncbi:MAG: hypothetical protein ACFFFH_20815 [Candidatus Thorarchaeota archaeon]